MSQPNEAVVYCKGAKHLEDDLVHRILPVENGSFSCKETKVKIHGSSREKEIVVVQSFDLSPNDRLMELILTIDALNRSGAKPVSVILPLFPYARQERKDDSGTPISARVVCDMLKMVNIKRLISIDLHATAIQGFMDSSVVFDHVSSSSFMCYHLSSLLPDLSEWILCSPDGGGIKRVQKFASLMGIRDLCFMDKTRAVANKIDNMKLLVGNVKKRKVLILDDMVDTGNTLATNIEILYGNEAEEVVAGGTHGIFSGGAFEVLNGKRVITTNTTNWYDRPNKPDSFECLNIKPLVNEIIDRIFSGTSMASFFYKWK